MPQITPSMQIDVLELPDTTDMPDNIIEYVYFKEGTCIPIAVAGTRNPTVDIQKQFAKAAQDIRAQSTQQLEDERWMYE